MSHRIPTEDRLLTAPITAEEARVWVSLDQVDWRNREDLMVLAGVTDHAASDACDRFWRCGLVVRRPGYADYRYRFCPIPEALLTARGSSLLAKLEAAIREVAV